MYLSFIVVIVCIGTVAIYANWLRSPCIHPANKLSVTTKETLVRVTDDKLFEIWMCKCKCDKCGATVQHKFSFATDKFYKPWRRLYNGTKT